MTPEEEAVRMHYDLEALKRHVEKRRENIHVFEKAIQGERDGIERDQRMIVFLEQRAGD